ncbi:MAG: L-threonylcarbamoyladenylate synthase [Anaerolineae bacterium]
MELEGEARQQITTRYLEARTPAAIAEAAEWLKQGQLVVFPTDTLYGIGADAFNPAAVLRLYQVKQRPRAKGIPILLADPEDLTQVVERVPAFARTLIAQFWPGPLTLVLPRSARLPGIISPDDSVAVRIPGSETTRALIRAAGGAVATSSANRSGQPPARDGTQALRELGGLVAAVLDDGPSPGQLASTIVDCTGDLPRILRRGPIPAEALQWTAAKR